MGYIYRVGVFRGYLHRVGASLQGWGIFTGLVVSLQGWCIFTGLGYLYRVGLSLQGLLFSTLKSPNKVKVRKIKTLCCQSSFTSDFYPSEDCKEGTQASCLSCVNHIGSNTRKHALFSIITQGPAQLVMFKRYCLLNRSTDRILLSSSKNYKNQRSNTSRMRI